MDGTKLAEQLEAEIRARLLDGLREVGVEMEDDLRALINTSYPPASAPGQPPHRRSGALQAAVYSVVEEFVDAGPTVTIAYNNSIAPHAKFLASGTSKMAPRPSIALLKEKWRERFPQRMQKAAASFNRSQGRR